MGTRLRIIKELGQMRFHRRRNRMLEPARLNAGDLPRQSKVIDEQPLSEALTPQRHCADARAFRRWDDTVTTFMDDVAVRVQLLQHRGDGGRRYRELLRDRRSRNWFFAIVQTHDRLEIHLYVRADFWFVRNERGRKLQGGVSHKSLSWRRFRLTLFEI